MQVRTTISLPDDLHAQLQSIARDRREPLSRTIEELVRRGMGQRPRPYTMQRSDVTGLMTISFDDGRVVTDEDVYRMLDDDE